MNGFYKETKTIERMKEGPLGRYIVHYAEQLHAEGYANQTGRQKLHLIADFSDGLNETTSRSVN